MRATWSTTFTRTRLIAGLLLGLTGFAAIGCTHASATRAQHRHEVASARALTGATSLESHRLTQQDGVVDVSELPTVVDMGGASTSALASSLAEHRFAPAAMVNATTVSSWIDADHGDHGDHGDQGTVVQIELRNACAVELDYAFGPSDAPSDVQGPRRVLESHTIQTQLIAQGDWLHLWDGDRWLGAAVTTAAHGLMEVSPQCDTLEVSFDLHERGPTSFAIHWELEADAHDQPSAPDPESVALTIEHRDAPQRWGPTDEANARVALRLANLCAEPVDYAFTPELADAPASGSTIPGHTERQVEIPAGWWLRYQALDDTWRGGATSSLSGAVLWLASDCIDFGVGDGTVIAAPSARGGGSK